MSKDMLGSAVRKLVTLPASVLGIVCDLLEKMSNPEWIEATKRFLRKQNPWPEAKVEIQKEVASILLKFVTTIALPAVDRFSVAEKIKVGETDGVEIGWIGENFQRVFGSLVETDIPAATLRISQLKKGSVDGPIIDDYGGTRQAAGSIVYMFEMLKKQGYGGEGVLLTSGYANIIHVPDPNNPQNFWAVYCGWGAFCSGWSVSADPVAGSPEWDADSQVVSRDFGS